MTSHETLIPSMSRGTGLRCFLAAVAGNTASSLQMWLQPLLLQYLVSERHLTEAAAGGLMTIELGVMSIACMIFVHVVHRRQAQILAMSGMVLATVASFATLLADSYGSLVAARAVVGLGLGATIMIANIVAANFPDPSKFYARIGCFNLICGALLIPAYPLTQSFLPAASPYTTLAIALLPFIVLMAMLPRISQFDHTGRAMAVAAAEASATRSISLCTVLLVAVTFAVVVCSGMVWTFYAVIGEQSGLSTEGVYSAISLSIFTAFIGSTLPALIGSRWGRVGPFSLSLIAMVGAIVVLTSHPSPWGFRVAVCVNVAAIYFILPYISALAIELDGGGRAASYVSSAFFFASAASPFIAGLISSNGGIDLVGRLTLGAAVAVVLTYIYVDRQTTQHSARLATVK